MEIKECNISDYCFRTEFVMCQDSGWLCFINERTTWFMLHKFLMSWRENFDLVWLVAKCLLYLRVRKILKMIEKYKMNVSKKKIPSSQHVYWTDGFFLLWTIHYSICWKSLFSKMNDEGYPQDIFDSVKSFISIFQHNTKAWSIWCGTELEIFSRIKKSIYLKVKHKRRSHN